MPSLAVLTAVGANSNKSLFANTPNIDGYIGMAGIYHFTISGNSRFWGELWMGSSFSANWQSASAATWLDAKDPPGFLAHGDQDQWVDVANAHDMNTRAINGKFTDRLVVDITDQYADGGFMPASMRGHGPAAGINTVELDRFMDRIR